ncbi:MAG: alanine--tRNA ligase, partial [Geminicoccaceae bacterium]
MTSVSDIRKTFLHFFEQHGHTAVDSSPLVPMNDPTLLFTNAGMVQFKNVFTGLETRDYNRAVTSQKCVRAGGKHNDLDNVGYTARHHTFFEMLGNFSFGDYFKDVAIELAWNLVTKEFALPADRLLVTVYSEDDDAAALWASIAGLPQERIIRIATSDNFWQMGDTGPCGPCSEIFYDHGPGIPGGPPGSADEDGDRFIEIWNLVFMQFEQTAPGERHPLPKPSIDTGMGLERIAAVLQGVHDNYEIDLFRRLINAEEELIGKKAEGASAPSFKVIADHLRASAFLIADGVLPSNEGRGYVLRRILRRGIRHAYILGARDPLMHRLVPVLTAEMGEAFPELVRGQALITEMLKLEEEKFRGTLEHGLRLVEEATASLAGDQPLPGATAFKLYDTFGFPLDLTQDVLRAEGRVVDVEGFNAAMQQQREQARAAWKGSGSKAEESIWFDLRHDKGATEFLGYETTEAEAAVVAVVVDGESVANAENAGQIAVVVNQTPFYGESGGQIGDTGVLEGPNGKVIVSDTQKHVGDLWVHHGKLEGRLAIGDAVHLVVDESRRTALRRAHSATHLMHAALRRHLGDHVTQKGSRVEPDRLRFDFSHHKAMTADEIAQVEAEVNAYSRQNDAVTTRVLAIDDARAAGAMALFGEKYGDEVRVVAMGQGEHGGTYSIELCGGTHARRTGDIALFKILSEGAVASGVRRIEAVTGEAALHHVRTEERLLEQLAGALRVKPVEAPERLQALLDERRQLEKEIARLRQELATGAGTAAAAYEDVAGIRFAGRKVDGVPGKELGGMVDALKAQIGSGVACVVSINEDKAAIVVGLSEDLKDRLSAVDLVRLGVAQHGGKGGGRRPALPQRRGTNTANPA